MKVEDEYRKNPLSHQEGGVTIVVTINGLTREYDKVKYPNAFMNKIIKNNPGADIKMKIKESE